MITHGAKRTNNGIEEIFHADYGWLPSKQFYDMLANDDDQPEPCQEIEERAHGERLEHFYKRASHYSDMGKDDYLD